jgi:hypothetical protein
MQGCEGGMDRRMAAQHRTDRFSRGVVTEAGRHTLVFFRLHTAQATRTCSRLVSSFEPCCCLAGGGGGGGDGGRSWLALGESMSAAQSR